MYAPYNSFLRHDSKNMYERSYYIQFGREDIIRRNIIIRNVCIMAFKTLPPMYGAMYEQSGTH